MRRLLAAALLVLPFVAALPTASAAASTAATTTATHVVVVSPGHSIDAAVRRVARGGTVLLRAGRYHQRVHLVGVHGVSLRPVAGAHAVLDGSGLRVPDDFSGMVTVAGSSDVTVAGLDITGYRTSRMGAVPVGIYVHGRDRRISIRRNHVHRMGNDNRTLGSFDINAHGIAVYGDNPHGAVRGLVIRGNTLDHLRLGASETVVVNGNVTRWSIDHNVIHDDNNIGIDAIGYEPTLPGRYRYTALNRARYGLITHNTVLRIRSRGNPSYWEGDGWCNCADGIYVDGGSHIRIDSNRVGGSDIGIEVAAENARGTADHVIVVRNRITGSLYTGIATGGYCNGAKNCGDVQTGSSHDNWFGDNRLRGNNQLDDGSPELLVQYHTWRDTFVHNVITATNSDHVVYGTVPGADAHGNRSDHNAFAAVGASARTAQFGWHAHTYRGFATYRRATGQDAHSRFVRAH